MLTMGAVCRGQSIPKKVLLTGPKKSGKTTLLYSWCLQSEVVVQSTLSFNVETVAGPKRGQVLLVFDVTDTGRRRQFFHGTEGIVYVVDGSDKASIDTAKADLNLLLSDRDLKDLPFILVISKQDLQSPEKVEVQTRLDLEKKTCSKRYRLMGVRGDNISTCTAVLDELCSLLYTVSTPT